MPRLPSFPGYGHQFQYYRPYNYRPHTPIPQPIKPIEEIVIPKPLSSKTVKQADPVWFDIFGIKLYFDDVLIRKDGMFVLDELKCLNPENLLSEE